MSTVVLSMAAVGLVRLAGASWTPPQSPVTIDVMVAYEAGAKDYVEGDLGQTLEAFSRSQVAKMNSVLPNTELDKCFKFRYVGHTNINVTCTDIGTVLYRSTYAEDYPEYRPIHDLREARGADVGLVMLYPEDSTGGTAGGSYGLQSYEDVADHSEKAYSVVSVVAAVQQDTSLHEIGHLMGAGHPDKPDPGGQHWKDYSHGYYFTDGDGYRWHTVMGYGSSGGCSYTATPFFSSPEYSYRGVPVGTADNDNTRTLRETCEGVSKWRETKYDEPTEAQIAARQSPSKPVFLFDAGAADATADGWLVADLNGQSAFSVVTNGIAFSHASDGGKFWNNGTAQAFSPGSFVDISGRAWSSVEEEMLVSLGLRETKEKDLVRFFQTGINMGAGTGEKTVNIAGLSPDKRYVLFYMACDGTNGKTGKFHLRSGYVGTPKVKYAKGTSTGYAVGSVGAAITANANEPLLVRVTNLRPDAQGKLVTDVGGATVNLLAIAEMPNRPSSFFIARAAGGFP